LEYPDETFDLVISEGVIHHTPDTQACVNEIHRILKAGGDARVGVYYENMILRSKTLFKLAMLMMKLFNLNLKGRGRNAMASAESPRELVRMYDGVDNPIGKVYGKTELERMFSAFEDKEFKRYYFPTRAARFHLSNQVQQWLNSAFGLMILVKAHKGVRE
jgi:ubiquinone/menaquinone biosynthesis C-methylase UbiE